MLDKQELLRAFCSWTIRNILGVRYSLSGRLSLVQPPARQSPCSFFWSFKPCCVNGEIQKERNAKQLPTQVTGNHVFPLSAKTQEHARSNKRNTLTHPITYLKGNGSNANIHRAEICEQKAVPMLASCIYVCVRARIYIHAKPFALNERLGRLRYHMMPVLCEKWHESCVRERPLLSFVDVATWLYAIKRRGNNLHMVTKVYGRKGHRIWWIKTWGLVCYCQKILVL